MDKKNWHLGLYDPRIPEPEMTTEECVALFHKNGRNHPVTRESVAAKAVRQAREQAEKNKQG